MASQVTFVGPLGDAHSLADELIVSPPPAPAHAAATATWAAKATALTWGGRTSPVPRAVPTAHVLSLQPVFPQTPLHLLHSPPPLLD